LQYKPYPYELFPDKYFFNRGDIFCAAQDSLLPFFLVGKNGVTIQMKATEQYSAVVLFITLYKVESNF